MPGPRFGGDAQTNGEQKRLESGEYCNLITATPTTITSNPGSSLQRKVSLGITEKQTVTKGMRTTDVTATSNGDASRNSRSAVNACTSENSMNSGIDSPESVQSGQGGR
mmetsp:Transcript_4276/g.12893  ORF Transcript_4276/g.12893 Transcript_4276/m.12893 type:complete len:109 (-) Transcript_4276:274-600(-)